MEPPRLVQIDLLKGLAIIAVIATHTLTFSQMVTGYANLYLWQAIPIFIIIMAFNAGNSFTRRGDATLRGLFSPSYFARRFERIVYPVLLIGLFELVIMTFFPAVVNNAPLPITPRLKMWLPPQTPLFLGWLPLNAPGNYFVSITLQSIVLFPLLYYFYKRASRATLVGCLAVNVAFEFAAPYIIAHYGLFWYTTSIVRYLGAIGLGLWITDGASVLLKRNWFILPGAAFSFAYLVASDVARTNVISYFEPYWFTQNVASFFYPLLLVVLGLRFLPQTAQRHRCGRGALWKVIVSYLLGATRVFRGRPTARDHCNPLPRLLRCMAHAGHQRRSLLCAWKGIRTARERVENVAQKGSTPACSKGCETIRAPRRRRLPKRRMLA